MEIDSDWFTGIYWSILAEQFCPKIKMYMASKIVCGLFWSPQLIINNMKTNCLVSKKKLKNKSSFDLCDNFLGHHFDVTQAEAWKFLDLPS